MIDLKKLSNQELRDLVYRLNDEIMNRSKQYNTLMKLTKDIRIENYNTTRKLIEYISEQLGYDIKTKSRKVKYVMYRHALYLYLRNLDNNHRCSVLEYGELFNCNHSTFIFNAKTAQDLKDSKDFNYLMAEDKIIQLINQFFTLNKTNHEQKFAKSTKQVPATC